jgi:transposase
MVPIDAIAACCGAHRLGRQFSDMGRAVRLMPLEYVKPYVKSHLNDDRDAEARSRELEALVRAEPCANRLRTVPGIGALNATALAAAAGDASTFAKGRDFAAWLGLVPPQITTGGRPRLVGISKRGSIYMRVLLIHGARSAMPGLAKTDMTLGAWLRALMQRAKRNVRCSRPRQ